MDEALKAKISESDKGDDITCINAWLVQPYTKPGHKMETRVDLFSDFSNHFKRSERMEFIEKLELANPGKYYQYVITYHSAN